MDITFSILISSLFGVLNILLSSMTIPRPQYTGYLGFFFYMYVCLFYLPIQSKISCATGFTVCLVST